MMRITKEYNYFLPIAIMLFLLASGVWLLPLTHPDEGRNAAAAWNMLSTGDYLTPMYNGEARLIKPPLLYYSMLPFMEMFGQSETAARLPSLISAIFLGLFILWWGESRLGNGTGWWAALIWATQIHVLIEARSAVPEMSLALWQFISFVALVEGTGITGSRPSKWMVAFAWICSGFAVMAKGPVGFLLPALAALISALWINGFKSAATLIKRGWLNPGVLLFMLIVMPWYSAMFYIHRELFIKEFFLDNTLARFTGSIQYHPYSYIAVYIPVLIAGFWLWLPIIPALPKAFTSGDYQDRLTKSSLVIYALTVIGFYFAASNKLHHYLLAAYPAICLLLGHATLTLARTGIARSIASIQGIIEMALALWIWKYLSIPFIPSLAIALIFACTGLVSIWLAKSKSHFPSHNLQTLRATLILSAFLTATFYYSQQYRPDIIGNLLKEPSSALYRYEQSSIIFYSGRTLPIIEDSIGVTNEVEKNGSLKIWGRLENIDALDKELPSNYRRKILWQGWDEDNQVCVFEIMKEIGE